jgi:16S rRNA (adenine1518-N6/adenine1519-N6)-dimethyltransferase
LSHRPRKRFGQHFLHDGRVIERLLDAIAPRPDDRLVEIGPGLGALTGPLLERCGRLDVVELDRELAGRLSQSDWARQGRLLVHLGDALRFDFRALAGHTGRLRVVGNLPYNISTPLIFHLLTQLDTIRDIHVMLQKEVVERLAAQPGDEAYGRLGVMVQYRCRVEPLFTVGPRAFSPLPRVDSAVVRLLPLSAPPVSIQDDQVFEDIVRRAFGQRRKTIRNPLKALLTAHEIERAGVDPGARPETLGLGHFAALANAVVARRTGL